MRFISVLLAFCLVVILVSCQSSGPRTLSAFTTDGCSRFPDGTHEHKGLWLKCCTAHDVKYWAGGSYDARMQADLALRACVKAVGEPGVADLMLAGVRVGGSPWWPTAFRWGYGWPFTQGYRQLTLDELDQVRRQIEMQRIN